MNKDFLVFDFDNDISRIRGKIKSNLELFNNKDFLTNSANVAVNLIFLFFKSRLNKPTFYWFIFEFYLNAKLFFIKFKQ